MLHRSIAFTVTALVTGALMAPPPASGAAAGETCQGQPATIVGTGPDVVGTPGDDVIVSGTSIVVNAGAGKDLVCLTGATFVRTDAGPGDDVVDASVTTAVHPQTQTLTDLGAGHDRFLGSPFLDTVWSNGVDDEVSAGSGRDRLWITLTDMPTGVIGSYDGGDAEGPARADALLVHSAAFDLEVGLDKSIVVDGMRAAALTGFQHAEVAAPSVVLRGNGFRNSLAAAGCEIKVNGKDGKDSIDTALMFSEPQFACARADRTINLIGGAGDDDLRGGPGDLRLSGDSGRDRLYGDRGADRLMGGAGHDRLYGGEGADRLIGDSGHDRLYGEKGADRLIGDSGHDRLYGEKGADRLIGGSGRDRADGGRGHDTGDAEIERRCER